MRTPDFFVEKISARGMMKRLAAILGLVLSPAVWATQYQVTLSANVPNDFSYPTIFGVAGPTTAQGTLVFDTALAPVITIPAGTYIQAFAGSFSVDIELIPKAAIVSLNLTAGITGAWSAADLQPQQFDAGQTYSVAIIGPLTNGPTQLLTAVSKVASGDFDFGGVQCPSGQCSYNPIGFAESNSDGALSDVTGPTATMTGAAAPPTAASDTTTLIATITNAANIQKGWTQALNAPLAAVSSALAAGQKTLAKLYLLAFADEVALAKLPLTKSGETATQAAQFTATAKAIAAEIH